MTATSPPEEIGARLEGREIICVSCIDWDAHWSLPQQVMSRLAKANRVLFMEVPVSPLSAFTGLRKGTFLRQLARWVHGSRRGGRENIVVVSPPPVLPWRYHQVTNRFSQWILRRFLEKQCNALGFRNPVIVTFQADSALLVKTLTGGPRIYFCADDWSASGRWWQPPDKVRSRERELVDVCDVVVATSRRLRQRLEPLGKPTFLVPNAVDYDLFSSAQHAPALPEITCLRHPRIGFIGMMTRNSFDSNLMDWLADRRSDWSFVIVGKQEGPSVDLAKLQRLSNVTFLGYRPLADLPKCLAGMDVCLIPWAPTEWVKSAFSLKLFEYLAAGKPVVARWTEEYLPYKDLVYLAKDNAEFEQCIERALREAPEDRTVARMRCAQANTWEDRVRDFSKIIRGALPGTAR